MIIYQEGKYYLIQHTTTSLRCGQNVHILWTTNCRHMSTFFGWYKRCEIIITFNKKKKTDNHSLLGGSASHIIVIRISKFVYLMHTLMFFWDYTFYHLF